jgi:hypothetical protein
MRALNNEDFLALWETGQRLHPIDQGLLAIQSSLPDAASEAVADWPLGRRNQALAQLRVLYFGPQLQGWTTCGQCEEKLEFEIDCHALILRQEEAAREPVKIRGQVFRLPTSRDLASIVNEIDAEEAPLRLLQQCQILPIETTAFNRLTTPLSREDIEAVSEQMALADPLAEISLGFECPNCHSTSQEILDLPSFLWSEIEARAKRLLFEVHALASAYGWAEAQILAMTDIRRATYLQMVGA